MAHPSWRYSLNIPAGYSDCSTWNRVRRPLGERLFREGGPPGIGRADGAGPVPGTVASLASYLMWKYAPDIPAGYSRRPPRGAFRRPLGEMFHVEHPGRRDPTRADDPLAALRGGPGTEGRSRRRGK